MSKTRRSLSGLIVGVLVAVIGISGASVASAATTDFQLVRTNLCLDAYATRGAYLGTCNGGNFQKFVWANPAVETTMRSVAETNKCLQQAGLGITLVACRPSAAAQKWMVWANTIKKVGTNYCIARSGPSNVILDTCNGSDYQKFLW